MNTQNHKPLKTNEISYIIEAQIRDVTVQEVLTGTQGDENAVRTDDEPGQKQS